MTFLRSNVLITGASSGLGLAVSKRFAQLGANTILLCRTEESGDSAVVEIKKSTGVSILMADPGPFKSALVREVPWPTGWAKNLFSAPVEQAADNILYVAQSDEARARTGRVFKKRQEVPLAPYWQDADIRQRLWKVTEAMIEKTKSRYTGGPDLQQF